MVIDFFLYRIKWRKIGHGEFDLRKFSTGNLPVDLRGKVGENGK